MARHYMQDIAPPGGEHDEPPRIRRFDDEGDMENRSIRDIRPSPARARLARLQDAGEDGNYPPPPMRRPQQPHGGGGKRRIGIWIALGVVALLLAGAAALMLVPSTSVTVVPRSQVVTFDASMPFTAYPLSSTSTGIINYAILSGSFEDSTLVQASGVEQAEDQAKGMITVYNNYSDSPVALIKNTRFQTPDGKIFRIPVSIDVPGKTANGPGTLDVEVFADQAGEEYNVGPFDRLTIPGLRSTSEMYENIYASSKDAFRGGFIGERPAVTESVLEGAQAQLRGRLEEKADELAATAPDGTQAFPGLYAVSYETLPPTQEAGGVRLNVRANVVMPVFPEQRLAETIARSVSANAEGQAVEIRFAQVTGAPVGQLSAGSLGQEPFDFTLGGRAQLVWRVDEASVAEALAGKEEGAFETIIATFPGIEEARARLMPFWVSTFPEAGKIRIVVEEPPGM